MFSRLLHFQDEDEEGQRIKWHHVEGNVGVLFQ